MFVERKRITKDNEDFLINQVQIVIAKIKESISEVDAFSPGAATLQDKGGFCVDPEHINQSVQSRAADETFCIVGAEKGRPDTALVAGRAQEGLDKLAPIAAHKGRHLHITGSHCPLLPLQLYEPRLASPHLASSRAHVNNTYSHYEDYSPHLTSDRSTISPARPQPEIAKHTHIIPLTLFKISLRVRGWWRIIVTLDSCC